MSPFLVWEWSRSRMLTILPGTHHSSLFFSMPSTSSLRSPGSASRANCIAPYTFPPPCVVLRIHRKCFMGLIICGRCCAGPLMPSVRHPAFIPARSSLVSFAFVYRWSQKSSQLPVCRKCRYASQMEMSSGVVLLCSFWCHCPMNLSSMPGRCPSLMPFSRMICRMPRRMSSPLPPPRGTVARLARNSCRDMPSSAVTAATAMRRATTSCLCAMSLPW
mmetsp:Transcript_41380/g.101967  ORF Transcript_41380/g.101967 Transcript_41380/m.101967 type:complete len:218 (+) Transcript_41380:2161-2814(+)